jgi:hypothetical protein
MTWAVKATVKSDATENWKQTVEEGPGVSELRTAEKRRNTANRVRELEHGSTIMTVPEGTTTSQRSPSVCHSVKEREQAQKVNRRAGEGQAKGK